MEICINLDELASLLHQALKFVYQFEQTKVLRFGLKYEGLYLLLHLEETPDCRIGDVAKEMKIPISTVSRIVDRLEKKGFLARHKDDSDKRIIRLRLEPAGRDIAEEVKIYASKVILNNIKGCSDKNLNAFLITAKSLSQILNTSEDDEIGV
ncbi:MarR family transcriptional regulator [bacterium]|nr:MarR family transcriptional regulator [bacterium]